MTEIDLEGRFPHLRPIRSAPSLFRINGCGATVYGTRDLDPETGTYVTTYCVCLLWIPILPLRAYRVADAEDGKYYLGREPLSGFAKLWNSLLVCVGLGLVGIFAFNAHVTSPEYLAGERMADAERLLADGRLVDAAEQYQAVIATRTSHADKAERDLKDLINGPMLAAPAADVAAMVKIVLKVQRRRHGTPLVADLSRWGIGLVNRFAESDPFGAATILKTIAPVVEDPEVVPAMHERLLERAVVMTPDDPRPASELAVLCEARGQLGKCETLLSPHQQRLGVSEGARILGQIYANKGELDASFDLLFPYAQERLERLHAAEEAYDASVERAWGQAIDRLNEGEGPDSFYRQYEAATDTQKDALVDEYATARLRTDTEIATRREVLVREASIVPAALDLGIVRLRRAQTMTDPPARQRELEAAEKTFLAIQGFAGESDEYRLVLGQVYYWLGRHDEGRKLLDELLAANERGFEVLLSVGRVLREVGAVSEARVLVEEAYDREKDQAKKSQAAAFRSLMRLDLDDQITWLRRADPAEVRVKAGLSTALGNKAIEEGDDEIAARHLRDAVAAYEGQPPDAAALNNAALAYFSLFRATGKRSAYDQGTHALEKAVAIDPSDSILLYNAAVTILAGATMDIVGDVIDLETLRMQGDIELLSYLYADAAGREAVREQVRTHVGITKALAHLDKVLVLQPKRGDTYDALASIHGFARDVEALQDLLQRLRQVELDLADTRREILDFYSSKNEVKHQKELESGIKRFERLVQLTRRKAPGATFSVAVAKLARWRASQSIMGLEVDADEIVALADEAHAQAPSVATHSALLAALLLRASRNLIEQNSAYADMAANAGRSLSPRHLIAVALVHPGKQQDAVRRNADVRRAMSLIIESGDRFPHDRTPWEWAMLRDTHPEEADKVAGAIEGDEVWRLENEIESLLSPLSAATAFDGYWYKLITGRESEGIEILRRCAAQGVPMPFDVQ